MLFVVVLEFFICWTPLYVINTIALFNAQLVYQKLGYQTISFFQLLAYSSSCCNPITYCFMNRGFRKACLNLFRCCKRYDDKRRISIVGGVTQSSEVTQLHRIHREAVLQTTYIYPLTSTYTIYSLFEDFCRRDKIFFKYLNKDDNERKIS